MKLFYHHPVVPFCRKIRLMLFECGEDISTIEVAPWVRDQEVLKLNPSGELPVLVLENGKAICGHYAITEYLKDVMPSMSLLGKNPEEGAEIRRICSWFDNKFYKEVYLNLVGEKLYKRVASLGSPDSRLLKIGRENIAIHMAYINWLMERRTWLGGDVRSVADFTAAAYLSLVDYLGEVPWEGYPEAKNWYAMMKSRPSFKKILSEKISDIEPPEYYNDPDF